ncbi:unnamed protein product [Symbiodinium natans]|uniref:Tyrosine-protein kinase ephrin type A/B receptor-like domain-containing protein n=1 Tax=Symbiodinium natans TaxID=878477 RepID=A0A812RDS7_9DINO|nr:unnamed protein product [Symbiodinium natans]
MASLCNARIVPLWLGLWLLLFVRVRGTCLPEARPVEERRNLTDSQGRSLPVGMNHGFNEISEIVTRIAGMLIQDALGYNVHINPRSGGERALYYLAGCDQPQSRTGCNDGPNQYHVALIPISERHWDTLTVFKSKKPEKVGTGIGYEAIATLHMTEEVAQHALQEKGLSLQYYSNWNASWWDLSKYFDNFTSIPTSQLLGNGTPGRVWLGDPTFMAKYVNITGDLGGLHPNGTGICPDGHWFLSPSCRANPSKCVPAMSRESFSGEDMQQILQKSAAFDMPLAIARARPEFDRSIVLERRVLFWLNRPDLELRAAQPVPVMFPAYDKVAYDSGDFRTLSSGFLSAKWISRDLAVLAPSIVDFITRLEMSTSVIEAMFDRLYIEGVSDEALCQWLLNNRRHWTSWIPDETQCIPGFGLYDSVNGEYIQMRGESVQGVVCKACESGHSSVQQFDDRGYTHVCTLCPPGTSQPSGAATSCTRCGLGEYQDMAGSKACKRCGVGSYQDELGATACKACVNNTTTVGLGSLSAEECGCNADFINIASAGPAQCKACPAGLDCPRSSSVQSFFSGESDLGEEFIPKIKEGYMSLAAAGLEVYQCVNSEACPGGKPGTCKGNSTGVACSECEEDQRWNGDECLPCEPFIRVAWFGVLACVCLAILLAHGFKLDYEMGVNGMLIFTFLMLFEVAGNFLQTLAIAGQMTLEWPQLLLDIFSVMEVFAFEATDLGISCIAGSAQLAQFTLQVSLFPGALLWLVCCNRILRLVGRVRTGTQLMSSLGQIVMACFSAVSNLSLVPFMCFQHPNGQQSNLQMLSIICGSSDHTVMLVMGSSLGALLIAFWCVCVWLLWSLPRFSMNEKYHDYVVASQFLIDKFRLDAWWFGLPLLLRGALLSFPLMLFTNNPASQVISMTFILIIYMVFLSLAWPFKVPLLNAVETACGWALILLILGGALHMPKMDTEMLLSAAIVTVGSLLVALVVLLVSVLSVGCTGVRNLRASDGTRFRLLDLAKLPDYDELADLIRESATHLVDLQHGSLTEELGTLAPFDLKLLHACMSMVVLEESKSYSKARSNASLGSSRSRSGLSEDGDQRNRSNLSLASKSSLSQEDESPIESPAEEVNQTIRPKSEQIGAPGGAPEKFPHCDQQDYETVQF